MNRNVIDLAVYTGLAGLLMWVGAPLWSLAIPGVAAASVFARSAARRT